MGVTDDRLLVPATLKLCRSHHRPGNIRELQNIVERSVILCTDDTFRIEEAWLSRPDVARMDSASPLTENLRSYEKELIRLLRKAREKSLGQMARLRNSEFRGRR